MSGTWFVSNGLREILGLVSDLDLPGQGVPELSRFDFSVTGIKDTKLSCAVLHVLLCQLRQSSVETIYPCLLCPRGDVPQVGLEFRPQFLDRVQLGSVHWKRPNSSPGYLRGPESPLMIDETSGYP